MPSYQKSVVITISRIYNWPIQQKTSSLYLAFYGLNTNTPILSKTVKTHHVEHELVINSKLKITYTNEEKQILIKMMKNQQDYPQNKIAEFIFDLDLLGERKVQYLPFSKNDKVLKIVQGKQNRQSYKSKSSVKFQKNSLKFEGFIKERQNFLKKISGNNVMSHATSPKHQSKTFAEKLYCLLQQAKNLRTKMSFSSEKQIYIEKEYYNDNKDNEIPFKTQIHNQERQLVKSSSQSNLIGPRKNQKMQMVNTGNANQQQWDQTSNNSQRSRLNIKNLRVVLPSQPEEIDRSRDQVKMSGTAQRREAENMLKLSFGRPRG